MHRLLARQLARLGLAEDRPPASAEAWSQLLARVSASYTEADQDRYTMERSLEISSNEMQRLYQDLVRSSQTDLALERDKLQKSVATLHSTLDASPDGILVVDPKLKLVNYNRRFLEIWNIPEQVTAAADDALYEHCLALLSEPDDTVRRVEALLADPGASSSTRSCCATAASWSATRPRCTCRPEPRSAGCGSSATSPCGSAPTRRWAR